MLTSLLEIKDLIPFKKTVLTMKVHIEFNSFEFKVHEASNCVEPTLDKLCSRPTSQTALTCFVDPTLF